MTATGFGLAKFASSVRLQSVQSWCVRQSLFSTIKPLSNSSKLQLINDKKWREVNIDYMRTTNNKRNMTSYGIHAAERPYVPRRTLMFVPGHDPKKLQKIPKLGVDCAVLECEDGVAFNMKEEARKNCKEALNVLHVKNLDLALRINSVSSGLLEDDLKAVIGDSLGEPVITECLPHTILVPKVDTISDLRTFTEKFEAVKLGRTYTPYFIFFVESAQGLMNLREILQQASDLSRDGHYILDGVVFGSDDFCADIGAERTKDASELIYARQKVVTLAKAFKIQAIDMVYIDIKDKVGLKAMSEEGARMGFTGKQIIHPSHVEIVEQAFTPSPDRVKWATELIQGFEEHEKQGQGAFVFEGQMIDMPLLRQAKNVLKIVNNIHS